MLTPPSAQARRPRGRPRKQPRVDTLDELGPDAQRLTRGGRQQLTQGKKRKAEDEPSETTQRFKPSNAMKQAKAAQNSNAMSRKERPVFDSPDSSPKPSRLSSLASSLEPSGVANSKDALLHAVTSQPEQPPAKRRRVIEQPDDGALLQAYV